MDIVSLANAATQMQQTQIAYQAAVTMIKKSQDVQEMMGEGALKLIEAAGADTAALAQGKGVHFNVTA